MRTSTSPVVLKYCPRVTHKHIKSYLIFHLIFQIIYRNFQSVRKNSESKKKSENKTDMLQEHRSIEVKSADEVRSGHLR